VAGGPRVSLQTVARGTTALRRWRVARSPDGLRLDLWTPWSDRLVLAGALVVAAFPGTLLWEKALAAPRIAPSVVATVYSLVVVYAAVGIALRSGRERVTIEPGGIRVERFRLVRWRREHVELSQSVEVHAASGALVELRRGLVIETGGRALHFGAWLTAQQAGRLREHLRAALSSEGTPFDAADGVVRRVAARRVSDEPGATDALLEIERRRPSVADGTLRSAPPLAGLGEAVFLLSISAAVVAAIWSRGHPIAWGVACVLLLLGVVLGREGWLARARRRRVAKVLAAHAGEPWRAVDAWTGGVLARSPAPRLGGLAIGIVLLAVCVGFLLLRPPWPPTGARALLGAVFGAILVVLVVRAQNVLFQGTTEVRLREMPYRTPGEVVVDFAVSPRGAAFDAVRFTLQRIVEVRLVLHVDFVGCSHLGSYAPPEDHAGVGPGGQVEARFTLPPGTPGTCLVGEAPAFWELVVEGPTSCGWYAETFPIPIYDAPRSP